MIFGFVAGWAVAMDGGAAPLPAGSDAEVPAVVHVTTDPLMPQSYRSIKYGKYPCSVVIVVSKEGKATDVENVECDEDAYYALATAILQWDFDPATRASVPVDSRLPYTNEFEVRTLLPRKHVVGFVGAAASFGGAGWVGAEARIHLGERISLTGGIDLDQDTYADTLAEVWTPVLRADFALSSRRQHFEHRGIYGVALGLFGDARGSSGFYAAFRGEVMTPVPGFSIGADAGIANPFGTSPIFEDVGPWRQPKGTPSPWLRASLIWYAPLPKDQFMVVPRANDPVSYEAIVPEPEPIADYDGQPFPGIKGVHWSELEPSVGGSNTPVGPGFSAYPPGSYRCMIRAAVSPEGKAVQVRVEKCPSVGKADALAYVTSWEWPARVGEVVQSVFPAPIFVRHDDAETIPVLSVRTLDGAVASPLPRTTPTPDVYVHAYQPPVYTHTLPTQACVIDIDIDATGAVLALKWVSGDIEVQPFVYDAVRSWSFYPVPVDGELRPVRARVSACGFGG